MIEQAQAIMDELNRRAALDPQLRQIMKKIEKGKATFEDTALLSQRMGNLLGELFGAEVLDIPEDAREAVCEGLLQEQYDSINETLVGVQEALDGSLGLHLAPQKAPFPAERVQQIAHSLLDPNVKPETIQRRANQPVATVAKSFHDDYIKTNAKLRNDLGLKPVLQRFGTGCCAWCAAVAGKWRFGEQPDNVFRRHDNCDCVIIYDTQVLRGAKKQDGGRSKTWTEVEPSDLQTDPPKVFSRAEAERLQENAVSRLTLAGERDIMRVADSGSIYHKITDESIRNVPLLDVFGNAEKNERYREANRALLLEAAKYEPGVEVSMVYDVDMKAIDGFGYVLGEIGHVKIENPGVPFHALHNHGSGETLSLTDIQSFVDVPNYLSITAIGNTGSVYSLARTEHSDSLGYSYFLQNKSKAVIFNSGGVDFTLEKIANKKTSEGLKQIVGNLSLEQRQALADAILSQTEKCLKGGAKYGFKYTEITP